MRILMTMLATNLILLFLPAIVYSKININIRPGKSIAESSVEVSGQDVDILSWKERKSFGLWDHTLNDAVKTYVGRKCDDLFLKNPTVWGDTYDKFGWQEVQRLLTPVEAKIVRLESKPIAVSTAEYVNNHNTLPSQFSTSTSHAVEDTVSHTWSKEAELSVEQEINYNFLGLGGTTTFSLSGKWGQESTQTRTVTIGTTSTIETTVPPGAKVLAKIIASQHTMEIEVKYKVTFNGCLFCHFTGKFEGHYFYCYNIENIQEAGNLPKEYNYTEKLNVGFYSDARLEIYNATTPIKKTGS